jgi:Ca2+/Na+ antiporter
MKFVVITVVSAILGYALGRTRSVHKEGVYVVLLYTVFTICYVMSQEG